VKYKIWVVALLALVGCGDPLVTGDYLGEPLMNIEGNLLIRSVARTPETLNISLFWMNRAFFSDAGDPWRLSEQPVVSRGLALTRYQIQLYQPPPEAALRLMPNGQRAGMALLMLYNDTDGDGAWDQDDELLVGGASQYILLYAPEGLDAEVLGRAIEPGYQLMRLDDPESRCAPGDSLASMKPATNEPDVNLVVFGELEQLLPDLDCDGYSGDWCEDILERAADEDLDAAQRQGVYDEFLTCLERAGLAEPCMEELPPEVFLGGPVQEADLASYDACLRQSDPRSHYVPEDECNFFLQELRWASSQEEAQALRQLYEQCLEDYQL
jgi:hypothetical protein